MPQVNVLPVNISKSIELKDESVSFDSTSTKGEFSRYIDLHLNKNKEADSSRKADSVESEANIAKKSGSATESKTDTQKAESFVENSDVSDENDSEVFVQKIAASGKKDQSKSAEIDQKALLESEQLMSFLAKADSTLIKQSIESPSSTPIPEKLTVEQKAHNEAQLLLNASKLVADLSPVAKALGNEQADVPSVPIQTLIDKSISAQDQLTVDTAKVSNKDSTRVDLSGELIIEGKNKRDIQTEVPVVIVKPVENKAVVSELKTEVKSEVKLEVKSGAATQVTNEVKITNIRRDRTNTEQQISNQVLPSDEIIEQGLGGKNNANVSVSAEQKIVTQVKVDHVQVSNEELNKNALLKEVIQGQEKGKQSQRELLENEKNNTNRSVLTQSTNKSQEKLDTVGSLSKTVDEIEKQMTPLKNTQHEKSSSLPDAQLTKSELTQNGEVSKANEKANQAVGNSNKTVLPNNQFTSNNISHDEVNKTQAKQDEKAQLSAAFTEQSQQKLAVKNEEEVLVEGKSTPNVKTVPSVNSHFIDVSGKATQTPQQIIEQQSAEMLNPSVATEVTQSQKTNGQLHQETISMFRKDFNDAVKDKVMLMISQKLQRFDITLDPPELGNMQVRVNLQGEQAVVSFLVQSQQTKEALEQNMHKLRDLLAEQGVDVGDANVEQQSQQSANEDGSTAQSNNHAEDNIDNMAEANDVVSHTLSAQMIDSSTASVDYYA